MVSFSTISIERITFLQVYWTSLDCLTFFATNGFLRRSLILSDCDIDLSKLAFA